MSPIPLRVLMIEDSEDDAFLVQRELRKGGYDVSLFRVESAAAMQAALQEQSWDVVISDYNLPGFSGLGALQVLKLSQLDVPFVLVSGAVGEEFAVEAMKAGAKDYIKKDNLARLTPAIQRELREAGVRRERLIVQGQLKDAEKIQETLYRVSQAASSAASLEDLMRALHLGVKQLMPAENFYLALYDAHTGMLSYPYFVDQCDSPPEAQVLDYGLTAWVIRNSQPLLASPQTYRQMIETGAIEQVGTMSVDWLGAPLKTPGGETIGALVVQTYDEGTRYSPHDLEVLSFICSQAAMSIQRRRVEDALRQREVQLSALLQAIPDVILVVNGAGAVLDYQLPSGEAGFFSRAVYGGGLQSLFPPEISRQLLQGVQQVLTSGRLIRLEYDLQPPGGSPRSYEARLTLRDSELVLVLLRDITEAKQAQLNLEAQRAYLRQVIDINPNLIFVKDAQGRFILANQAVADVYGVQVEDLIGKTDADFNANEAEVSAFQQNDMDVLRNRREKQIAEEKLTDCSGQERWMQTVKRPLTVPGREETHVLGVSTDITERKRMEEQMLYNAFHDTLTGLPNRALLLTQMNWVIERSHWHPDSFYAVILLDLDRFKMVNDSLGHRAGDHLLIAAAGRLGGLVQGKSLVARIGGDEFVILMEELENLTSVTQTAERVLAEMSEAFVLQNQRVTLTTSIGIVLGSAAYERAEDVLRDADIAMYRAKNLGRGRYAIFNDLMRDDVVAHLEMETDLRLAIQQQQLEVHYEPIINLQSGKVVSFEALVRWRHPVRGRISPAEFIPFAEDTGLIIPLGEWVLLEACRQMKRLEEKYPWTSEIAVSVNISSRQFAQPELLGTVRNVLEKTGLAPARLRVEITETVLMQNAELAIATLNQLRQMGIQIYIDDFGTGYSSLFYLHRLPLNAIKIDRSFVSGAQGLASEIVHTIVQLANDLRMFTIAEGVESVPQLDKLDSMGCRYVQGFLFRGTMDIQTMEAFMAEHQTETDWVERVRAEAGPAPGAAEPIFS